MGYNGKTLRWFLAATCASLTLAVAVDGARAQDPDDGVMTRLVDAIDRGDSAYVRQALADPAFRETVEAAGYTAPLLQGLGQAETLDADLRHDAWKEAIALGWREIDTADEGPSRSARSAAQYDLLADYVLFLEQDYLLHRLASLPGPDRGNPNHIAAVAAVLDEVRLAYSGLLALLPPCGGDPACVARRDAVNQQWQAFNDGLLAGAVRLAQDAVREEERAYLLFGNENQYGSSVRSYEAAARAFTSAADLFGQAAARVVSARPDHRAVGQLNAYRDKALERASYAARIAAERGPDRDDRPPPPPPSPPPPPPPPPPVYPPPPLPPVIDDQTTLAAIARAQNPDLLTPYQRDCLASSEEQPLSAAVDLYYATSRRPVPRPDAARDLWFGTAREAVAGDRVRLNYGVATVNVPCERERGDLPRPATLLMIQLEPLDPEKHFHLKTVTPIADEAGWLAAIDQTVAPTRRREVLVYVHGYNNGFADASYRAGQLHADLGIDGATVFYSWASRERPLRYRQDRATVESESEVLALADTLAALRNSEATTVYLVAHSMGNRLMMSALAELAGRADRPVRSFDELVMGSADMEPELFQGQWARARTLVDRATLYASSQDKAMWGARLFAGDRRIGDAAPQPLVFDGVQTIDTTEVGGSGLGHDDYSAGGLANVQASVWFDLQPGARCILAPSGGPPGTTWWSILPDEPTWRSDCTHVSFSDAVAVARLKGSFSEAFAWMNQVYPPPAVQAEDESYAGRIRRLFRTLIGRR